MRHERLSWIDQSSSMTVIEHRKGWVDAAKPTTHAHGLSMVGSAASPHSTSSANHLIAATNFFASSEIFAMSPEAIAALSTSELPTPRQQAPALRNSAAEFKSTPPVGMSR